MKRLLLFSVLLLACSGGAQPPIAPGSPTSTAPGPPANIAGWWVGTFGTSSASQGWGRVEQDGNTVDGRFRGRRLHPLASPPYFLHVSGTLTGHRFAGEFTYSTSPGPGCFARGAIAGYVDDTDQFLTFYTGDISVTNYPCFDTTRELILERDSSPVTLRSFEFSETLIGGERPSGRVYLSKPAPPGGLTISLSSSTPLLSVPPTVILQEWDENQYVVGESTPVTVDTPVTITASDGTVTLTVETILRPY